jgi:RecA-family ATPase
VGRAVAREKRLRGRAAMMFCFHVSVGSLRNAEVRDKSSKEGGWMHPLTLNCILVVVKDKVM